MSKKKISPPALARKILNRVMPCPKSISVLGDYEELFIRKLKQDGVFRAKTWYWFEVLRSLFPFFITSLVWRFIMLRNHLKVACRNMRHNKTHSGINIAGLTIGLTSVFLVLFWVQNELSVDRFHKNRESIYRLTSRMNLNDRERNIASTPGEWGEFLKGEFSYIRDSVRIRRMKRNLFEYNDTKLMENGGIFADPSLLNIFSFPLVERGAENPLKDPDDMLITQSMTKKYFPGEDAVGKTVRFAGRSFIVRGVLADIPSNSHLQFDFVCPMSAFNRKNIDWYSDYFTTYILSDRSITGSMADNMNVSLIEKVPLFKPYKLRLQFQPMADIYLKSRHLSENAGRFGDINHVYIFSVVAILILIIAAVNYVNITTAFAGRKAPGIGIRKTFGATGKKLFEQFMTEGMVLVLISVLFSIGLAKLLLPVLNRLSGGEIVMDFFSINTILLIMAVGGAIGLIAGVYPALYLSSLKPVRVLHQGTPSPGSGRGFIGKSLLTLQFFIAVFIICCTITVIGQLQYISHKNLGFNRKNVMTIPIHSSIGNRYTALKNSLKELPEVADVTAKSSSLTDDNNGGPARLRHQSPEGAPNMRYAAVEGNYFSLLEIPILHGRSFEQSSDAVCIINQKAQRLLNIKDPVGKIIINNRNEEMQVIGVAADASFYTLKGDMKPRIFTPVSHNRIARILVKLKGSDTGEIIRRIERIHQHHIPGYPFEYRFLDETYAGLYQKEKRLKTLLNGFSILAIFISCMGLFGLVSYTVERKKKEIGIRKTLGASSSSVIKSILGDFIPYILLGFFLAAPPAYYAISKWLDSFANRITPGPLIFTVSGTIVLMIAVATIGLKSLAAAGANPVDSIRYE